VAIKNLLARRSPGGTLALMECSRDGVEQLQRMRARFGKEPWPNIEPWHNCFMRDANLARDFGARVVFFSAMYMFLAKVIHKKLSWIGRYLPPLGRFGYDRLYLIR